MSILGGFGSPIIAYWYSNIIDEVRDPLPEGLGESKKLFALSYADYSK